MAVFLTDDLLHSLRVLHESGARGVAEATTQLPLGVIIAAGFAERWIDATPGRVFPCRVRLTDLGRHVAATLAVRQKAS